MHETQDGKNLGLSAKLEDRETWECTVASQWRMTSFFKPVITGDTDASSAAPAMIITMITKPIRSIYFTITQGHHFLL